MQITTNNVPRDIIEAHELTKEEQAEFDYYDWNAVEKGEGSAEFFRYKGQLYDLGEFMHSIIPGWDGYQSDSYFSGMVVRYVENFERVVVGRYCT